MNKNATKQASWKNFKDATLKDGMLPLQIWGTNRMGKREVIEQDAYDTDREVQDAICTLSSCFYCFESIFHCYVDEAGKFRSVTIG